MLPITLPNAEVEIDANPLRLSFLVEVDANITRQNQIAHENVSKASRSIRNLDWFDD
jgi:hypothetical protein